MSFPPSAVITDPRLILREEELDAAIEVFVLAEAAFWASADDGLDEDKLGLGRGHYRAALFLKRRPGIGVQDLARLTGLSKQAASKALKDLISAGYATSDPGEIDARRRPTRLTQEGKLFEGKVSARLREHLARAYRDGGLDAAPGARRILAAIAGPRAASRRQTGA